ncbi:MAG: hypothetical protein HZA93_06915 [Verrucomicrobia bacterium]|nr:hypothetical protein [Verrucomicrobiota bacterium]
MLFDFRLRPLDEITPWGEPPDLSLSWFGLTDGLYRLEVGDEHLFSYTDEISASWAAKHPGFSGAYVDYQVVRLWEDVCSILPDVLSPIPPAFAAFFSGKNPTILAQLVTAEKWWRGLDDSEREETNEDTYRAAITWAASRRLDSLYLKGGPRIWMSTFVDTFTITWDNSDIKIDETEVWSARRGSYSMPRSKFLEEVRSFNSRLLAQMHERVQQVCADWRRPEIRIDFEQLRREQIERAETLPRALATAPTSIDWESVQAAIQRVANI